MQPTMNAIDALASIGGWISLLSGSAAWIAERAWRGKSIHAARWLLSVAVILFYYSMVLRYLVAELDWEFSWRLQITRFDVSAIAIPVGLFCCWFGVGRWVKVLGVAIILAGFVNAFPGLLYPIEGAGTG